MGPPDDEKRPMNIITQNPYRVLGVLSNAPIKERVANQNRLNAFAKVGKEVTFPNDFSNLISEKPIRTAESIAAANTAINLDKDQLKYALFWFLKLTPIDEIAFNHLQSGDKEKAIALLQQKETCSSLINFGVLSFLAGDIKRGFYAISYVIHTKAYRQELLHALKLETVNITEEELAEMFITAVLNEVQATELLKGNFVNETDKSIISKQALNEPIATINAAIDTAKSVDMHDATANLQAGKTLMNSTKAPLQLIRDIVGADSPQYQFTADNLAKQILQCGINYYNNAPDDDVESPKKAMVLQKYALAIAVGKLTKDRCQENYNTLKRALDNMPPKEVALEANRVRQELRKFSKLPDLICHAVTLLEQTQPDLSRIKQKIGGSHPFYLHLSTQIVSNALHNIIAEVNDAQKSFNSTPHNAYLESINRFVSLTNTVHAAWGAMLTMDKFDIEEEFKLRRYRPNRETLKEIYSNIQEQERQLSSPTSNSSYSNYTSSKSSFSKAIDNIKEHGCAIGCLVYLIISIISAIVGAFSSCS